MTEFIIFSSPKFHKQYNLGQCALRVGDQLITASTQVRDLGSIIDRSLSMEANVNTIIRSMYCQMRKVSKLRQYLDESSCAKVVNSLITSRLDYNNSLLYGLPKTLLHRLQVAQNQAARLVTRTRRREHITPVLRSLHWLPVEWRIQYKILLHVYKCMNCDSAPSYLKDLIQIYVPNRQLRSSSDTRTLVQPIARNSFGKRAFVNSAPALWNTMPYSLRHCQTVESFKRQLKTYLFVQCFNA